MSFIVSVDVEPDLHTPTYQSVDLGLLRLEKMCEKTGTKPILFVTADCIEHNPRLFKRLAQKKWEISLHGYRHIRYDELSYEEKKTSLIRARTLWKKKLGFFPKGFRAPQHSIDTDTLDLLAELGFAYDSSYIPLNLFQFFFFPSKSVRTLSLFFSRLNPYMIRPHLQEIPCSALGIPFVSLTLRVLPSFLIIPYYSLLTFFYKRPLFYAHSWDFIALPRSKIDRLFPHHRFIYKLQTLLTHI